MVTTHKNEKVCSNTNKHSDMNVDVALKDPRLYPVFYDWAVANLCSENLQFYEDAEKYKGTDPTSMRQEAERIYLKFIKEGSYSQINLDYETRRDITQAIQLNMHHKDMFVPAQCMIMELIKYDLLVKFMDSNDYRGYKGLPVVYHDKRALPRKNSLKRVAKMPRICAESIYHLEKCLVDPIAMEEFLSFTKAEFSDALLLFYLDVQQFRENPSLSCAINIFERYLSETSLDEVDADPKVKKMIWRIIQGGSVTADLFDKLQSQVFAVMAQDNFFRFQLKMISRLAIN